MKKFLLIILAAVTLTACNNATDSSIDTSPDTNTNINTNDTDASEEVTLSESYEGTEDIAENTEGSGERSYRHKNVQTCKRIRYFCPEGERPFSDETGCGCEK